MHIIVLGNEGSWYVSDLIRSAREQGHTCERGDFQLLSSQVCSQYKSQRALAVRTGEEDLLSADAVIVRTMPPGSLEQVVYRMDVLHRLEANGVQVFNSPRAIECAVDKFLTTSRLAEAGLPVPETVVCENSDQALEAFVEMGGDIVVKPLFGAEGRGILRVSDPDLALRVFRTLERLQSVLYLQKFIQHPGHDMRLLVLDGRVLGAITRHNPHDFRTNLARQGTAQIHIWTKDEERLALAAADVVGARFAGIDLLYDREGCCYVIEANGVPGWRGFARTTGLDVGRAVVESLSRSRSSCRQELKRDGCDIG